MFPVLPSGWGSFSILNAKYISLYTETNIGLSSEFLFCFVGCRVPIARLAAAQVAA